MYTACNIQLTHDIGNIIVSIHHKHLWTAKLKTMFEEDFLGKTGPVVCVREALSNEGNVDY